MTRKEFSTKTDAIRRNGARNLLAAAGLLFVSLTIMAYAPFYLRTHPDAHSLELAEKILLVIAVGGGLLGTAWTPYHLARKWGLACPKCGKLLLDLNGRIALLTGNCPKCENQVFNENVRDPGSPAKRNWCTKEQFKAKLETRTRKATRRELAVIVAIFPFMLIFAFLSRHFQGLIDQGRFDGWLASPAFVGWIALAMLAALVLPYLIVCWLVATKRLKFPGIPCPECGRLISRLAAPVALEKNICIYCGAQLFDAAAATEKA